MENEINHSGFLLITYSHDVYLILNEIRNPKEAFHLAYDRLKMFRRYKSAWTPDRGKDLISVNLPPKFKFADMPLRK